MANRSLPASLMARLSAEEIAVLQNLDSNKNSKSISKENVEEQEKKPVKEADGLSDLDEYDMECEVMTGNPAGD